MGPQWYYPVLLVDDKDLAELTGGKQHIAWSKNEDKQFVVIPVHKEALETLKKHPGYCTDNLATLQRDFKVQMSASVKGNRLTPKGDPVIPMAYAGEHSRQTKGKVEDETNLDS